MYEQIRFETSEGLATLTLNRPERLNAYTPRMGEELVDAFGRARQDDAVRAVVWTGAGRGFCAGVDLELLKQARAGAGGDGPKLGEEAFLRSFPLELAAYPKPVIAAVNGPAIGVGVTMILGCDVRLAADTASLGMPFVRLGILPGLGSSWWLPRLVGPARARELVLSGRNVPAREAAEMGLVNRVVPADALLGEARALARAMAEASPEALMRAKRILDRGARASLEEALRDEQTESEALRAALAPRRG